MIISYTYIFTAVKLRSRESNNLFKVLPFPFGLCLSLKLSSDVQENNSVNLILIQYNLCLPWRIKLIYEKWMHLWQCWYVYIAIDLQVEFKILTERNMGHL